MSAKLIRREAAAYVRDEHGLPCSVAELERLASSGRGPKFQRLDGWRPIYDSEALDEWAAGRLGPVIVKASDHPIRGRRATAREGDGANVVDLVGTRQARSHVYAGQRHDTAA
jgi:hypothetical protein